MLHAVDLHLHSPYADAVSDKMTLAGLAVEACRKGLDVLATGDCLQPQHLAELRRNLVPAEPGWFQLAPGVEHTVRARLPESLHRPLRFVLSTEVSCTLETDELRGVHILIYFPSFEHVDALADQLAPYGDLTDGRPTLRMHPSELLRLALACEGCEVAPAHVFNPYFSALGTRERRKTLVEHFGDLTPRLLAVETGLPATPPMCRRISALDRHGLFACSDAHSLENLGREYTLLDIEPGFAPMIDALRRGTRPGVRALIKVPLEYTRFLLNYCARCQASYEALRCPKCGISLPMGSLGRLEQVADRATPHSLPDQPPFLERLPLLDLLAVVCDAKRSSSRVTTLHERLLTTLGNERQILGQLDYDTLAAAGTPPFARMVVDQRRPGTNWAALFPPAEVTLRQTTAQVEQMGFSLGEG